MQSFAYSDLLLFLAQGFFILMRFSYLVISRGQFLQVFVQLPVDIMQILCTTSSSKLSHRFITHHMEKHPLQLVLNLPLMLEHDGLSSHFWQRKCTDDLHVTHNYIELHQTIPKFLFKAEDLQPMKLLFMQKAFLKKRKHPCCPYVDLLNPNAPQRPFCKQSWDCCSLCASLYIYLHCISSIILLPSHSVFEILHSLPLSYRSE